MGMLEYIERIQKKLISEYGFTENPNKRGTPIHVPDGEYPMVIGGKRDKVRIKNGLISCCNYD